MPLLAFHCNLPSENRGAEQPLTRGELYLETPQGYFPCLGWSDRPRSSISHWIGNCIGIIYATAGRQRVPNYFMDGPYYFTLQKSEPEVLNIQFLRRVSGPATREEIPSLTITSAEYCNALLSVAERILSDPRFLQLENAQMRKDFARSIATLQALL